MEEQVNYLKKNKKENANQNQTIWGFIHSSVLDLREKSLKVQDKMESPIKQEPVKLTEEEKKI
jgi:hypothetical protein